MLWWFWKEKKMKIERETCKIWRIYEQACYWFFCCVHFQFFERNGGCWTPQSPIPSFPSNSQGLVIALGPLVRPEHHVQHSMVTPPSLWCWCQSPFDHLLSTWFWENHLVREALSAPQLHSAKTHVNVRHHHRWLASLQLPIACRPSWAGMVMCSCSSHSNRWLCWQPPKDKTKMQQKLIMHHKLVGVVIIEPWQIFRHSQEAQQSVWSYWLTGACAQISQACGR